MTEMNLSMKQKTESKLMLPGGEGEGTVRESGMDMDTLLFNMENQQGPAGQHRELCSILCNNLMVPRGKDGGRDS